MIHPHKQEQIQDFLREGTSQPEMTDVPGHNWLTDCFNKIFDCSIRVFRSFAIYVGGRVQQAFGRAWALPGPPLTMPLPSPRSATEFAFICYKGNWPKADTN